MDYEYSMDTFSKSFRRCQKYSRQKFSFKDHKTISNGEGRRKMEENQKGKRLVLVASPFQGHMTPMLQLGTALLAKGFSITIAHANINSPNPSTHPNFNFLPLSVDLSGFDSSVNLSEYLEALNRGCRMGLQESLAQMSEKQDLNDHVVGIMYDSIMYFVEDVADDLKIRRIVYVFSSAAYLVAYNKIVQLHAQGNYPPQVNMLQEPVPELYPLRYRDLPLANLTLKCALELIAIGNCQTTPLAFICNTIDCLEHLSLSIHRRHYKVPIFHIGPLHKVAPSPSINFLDLDTDCLMWLDKQAPKSVIYVSFGTYSTLDPKDFAEIAWGLANSNQPFLWVIRPGLVRGKEWIEFLPKGFMDKIGERGRIVKWAPQKEVLAHVSVGGYWSHCGWNSALESICEGVPMICISFDIDQGVNVRYLCHVWKVGIEMEKLERQEIDNAIRRLFRDKEGEEMRQRTSDMKEKVQAALQQGGSSYNSLNELVEFILSGCQTS